MLNLALLILAGFSLSDARAELPAYCKGSTIQQLQVPVHPGEAATHAYRVQVVTRTDFGLPENGARAGQAPRTLVWIPGGPGGAGSDPLDVFTETPAAQWRGELALLRDGAIDRVIYIDPRGLGCNQDDWKDDELWTELHAHDIAQVIQARVPGPYMIVGISYGSVVAQWVGHWIARLGVRPPRLILIDGVMSRAYRKDEGLARHWVESWNLHEPQFSPEVREALKSPAPFGVSRPVSMVSTLANKQGLIEGGVFYDFFAPLALHALDAIKPAFRDLYTRVRMRVPPWAKDEKPALPEGLGWLSGLPFIDGEARRRPRPLHGDEDPSDRISRIVGCNETDEDLQYIKFVEGKLVEDGEDSCASTPLSAHAFDTHGLTVTAPMLIGQGLADPNTPPWGAQEVFDVQTGADRILVSIRGIGHGGTFASLSDCMNDLVNAWFGATSGAAAIRQSRNLLDSRCSAKPFLSHRSRARQKS